MGVIHVAKSSSNLWYTTNQYLKTEQPKPKKNIVKADAAASSAYFVGIGVSAAVGMSTPVTAAAVLGGWAISAGLGSAYHYFGIE